MFVPLAHAPRCLAACACIRERGHAQADFGEAMVVIGGPSRPLSAPLGDARIACRAMVEQKAHFFALDFPHGDACFVRAYPAAVSEARVDGHVHAFAFFARVPQSVLYDNDRCLVVKILPGGTRKRAKLFEPGSCRTASFMTATAARARATTRGLSRAWSVLRPSHGLQANHCRATDPTSWCPFPALRHGMPRMSGWQSNAASVRPMFCVGTATASGSALRVIVTP